MITEQEVVSSQFNKVKYNSEEKTLIITFNNGKRYEYLNVPQLVFECLMSADSLGKFFIANIKNTFSYRPL
ncbi:KTSC domain-containing protein [Listeria monocytogenes]|uniref:KTSC domain-containing protein n=1 Tax=Listeria monocytogenes TaxID=1639 RepID=UPI003B4286CF